MGIAEEKEELQESTRKRRREYAAKRLSLGFNDKGKEEVEDKIMEDIEYKSQVYALQLEELKDKKPVTMDTSVKMVKGISKKEIEDMMLRDSEKFKPI